MGKKQTSPARTTAEEAAYQAARQSIQDCHDHGETELQLKDPNLTRLPPEIGSLHRLEELIVRRCGLKTLPPEIWQLSGLKELDLYGNQLKALSPKIGQLSALESLVIAKNKIKALPPEIGRLTALKRLDIELNPLATLPPEIGGLKNLERLSASELRLTACPPEIFHLTELRDLLLTGNGLQVLPPEIGCLTRVTKLLLYDNQLKTLPKEIGRLTALEILFLSGNPLVELPPEIGSLPQLKWLALERTALGELPEWLNSLPHLETLGLHGIDALGLPPEVLGTPWQQAHELNPVAKPKAVLDYYFAHRADIPAPPDRGAVAGRVRKKKEAKPAPLDRDAIADRMRTTAPRCLANLRVAPAPAPEAWDAGDISVWGIACRCGGERGALLGYPLSRFNRSYSGDKFVGPLGFECGKCGRTTEIFDTNQHGYHAEACASPLHASGEGPRESFLCPDCHGRQFEIVTSFFFWEASIDLVEDEPEEFESRAQDIFCEFVAHGRCEQCHRLVRFADFGKL